MRRTLALIVCIWVSWKMTCEGSPSGCIERSLIGKNRLNIPDRSYTASSYLYDQYRNRKSGYYYRYVPKNAKLNGPFGWSPRTNGNNNDYLQIDLGDVRTISAVATQGTGKKGAVEWVTRYKLQFKTNSETWVTYGQEISVPRWFKRNGKYVTVTSSTVFRYDLAKHQTARYIRFIPLEYKNCKTIRVNVFVVVGQEAPRVTATPSQRSILVQWTINPCFSITGFIVNVTNKGVTNVGNVQRYNIKDLHPFTEYEIQVKAVPDGSWSDKKKITTNIAAPESSPDKVNVKALSSTTVQVIWTRPPMHLINGPLTGYRITYTAQGKSSKVDVGVVNTWNLTSLDMYTWYTVTVSINNTKYVGPPSKQMKIRTMEDAPSVPDNFQSSLIHPKGLIGPQLRITWDLPRKQNGEVRKFLLRYFYNDTSYAIKKVISVSELNNSFSISMNVRMMGTLIYQLSAFTIKEGPYQDGHVVVPAYPPWDVPSNISAVLSNTSIVAVSWSPVPENKLNCNVTTYDVKLVTCQHTNTNKPGKTADKMKSIPVTETSTVFLDLLPCSMYNISVRGNTKAGPGPFSKPIIISTQPDKSMSPMDKERKSNDTTIGLVIALLLVIIVMVALGALIWKYRRSRNFNRALIGLKFSDLLPPSSHLRRARSTSQAGAEDCRVLECVTEEEAANHYSSEELSPLLPVVNFLKPDGSIDECSLKKQFKTIPSALQYESKEAVKPHNKNKNRYKNIVTYDRSRVILRTESNDTQYMNTSVLTKDQNDESDYINASFVQGYDGSPRTYIAAQGPRHDTITDFWRMVWDQNTKSIVMLTKLLELGKRKCHQYWPEGSELYGDITVSNHQTQMFADYVIRTFYVSKTDQPSRQVRQFHFTTWPDKGVPQHASAILTFRRKVIEQTPAGDASPIVVHCSAGVGRSGAYIMIDAMLQKAKQKQALETYNYLQTIRGDRPFMVQTEDQYIFVHKAVYEELSCGNTEIQVENLNVTLRKLTTVDESTNIDGFTLEFQRLHAVTSKDIAIDGEKRVILSQNENAEEKYINASYVNTYREKDAYIVTQTPTDNMVGDIWRLVMDYDIGTIVMLNKLQEKNQDFHQYWPTDREVLTCDGINVKQLKVVFLDDIVIRTFQAINSTKSLDVVHLQHIGWEDKRAPANPQSILNLLNEVEKSQQKVSGRSPVLILCSNGIGRSGTFCAVASTLERVKQEQVLDVFQTVKSIRASRPGAVETLGQYKFCYTIVQNYLDSFSEYDNFARK